MEMEEKAIIRIEHWLRHNESHLEEYKRFAEDLDRAGNLETAQYIQEMAALMAVSNECLKKALASLSMS